MTNSDRLSASPARAAEHEAKCEKCGATTRLDSGICMSCLLRGALKGEGEVSKALYETVLDELDARDKPWFLGNYEILEQIGCGGMGVIYRARQRHSQRIVAVKRVLSYRADSHGALERFRREARAVASLDHPNILPIYEVNESEDGLPFFSMKFAEKGSLHENLASLRDEPRKGVQLMAKVARAVEYAHSCGVLHRDIKPGNILLNDRDEPLVSDFGLAKLLDGNNDLTRSLTTFGTAGFIAPEQAGHAAVDFTPAADVYSLGAVLFNVLAGRPPFLGSNPVSVIRKASETQAPKLRSLVFSLDRDLETICARCLERDPKARYQSAGDVAADLERWLDGRPIVARPVSAPARLWRWSRRNPKLVATGIAGLVIGAAAFWLLRAELFRQPQFNPPDRSIAVLPFTDSSKTKDQEYLCDGISENILDTLAQVDGLRVISSTSSFAFKGKNTNASEVGQKLNVGNVLEGSLQRQGNRVRVRAELVDARNGFRVWTKTYDGELNEAFALQDEIARSIVDALTTKFALRRSIQEQPRHQVYDPYLERLLTDVTHPTETSRIGVTAPVQNPANPATVLDHTSIEDVEARSADTRMSVASPETASTSGVPSRALETRPKTNKTTADVIPAAPRTGFATSDRSRAPESNSSTNKITPNVTAAPRRTASITSQRSRGSEANSPTKKTTADPPPAPPRARVATSERSRAPEASSATKKITPNVTAASRRTASITSERSRASEAGARTDKVSAGGSASIQGFAQTKSNQPTQQNFDVKQTSQSGTVVKGGKRMVWVPSRTGSHIGGNWVEVDDRGKAHSGSNIDRVTLRNW